VVGFARVAVAVPVLSLGCCSPDVFSFAKDNNHLPQELQSPATRHVTATSTTSITEHEAKIEDQSLQQPQVRQCMRLLALDGAGQLLYFLLAGVAATRRRRLTEYMEYLDIAL
jgi:hypothetical protein